MGSRKVETGRKLEGERKCTHTLTHSLTHSQKGNCRWTGKLPQLNEAQDSEYFCNGYEWYRRNLRWGK